MEIDALVLAGGVMEGNLSKYASLEVVNKAFLPINKKPMVEYVIDALKESEMVKRIFLVLPPEVEACTRDKFQRQISGIAPSGSSIWESLQKGVEAIPSPSPVILISACDLPLLSPSAVNDFIQRCSSAKAWFYYSFISREDSEKAYPGLPHTYVRLKQGTFCGGGIMAIHKEGIEKLNSIAIKVINARKNPLKLASLLGIKFIIKFLTGRLNITELETKASQILSIPVKGIHTTYPEIGFNVDDEESYLMARRLMER